MELTKDQPYLYALRKTLEHIIWNCFVDKYKAIFKKKARIDIK
jgi:hypothetical protein